MVTTGRLTVAEYRFALGFDFVQRFQFTRKLSEGRRMEIHRLILFEPILDEFSDFVRREIGLVI